MSYIDDLVPQLLKHPKRTVTELKSPRVAHATTFENLHGEVTGLISRLEAAGVRGRVGILGKNSREWIVADLALIELRCLSVAIPLDADPGRQDHLAICDAHNLAALIVIAGASIEIVKHSHSRPRSQSDSDALTITFSSSARGAPKATTISKRDTSDAIKAFVRVWAPNNRDNLLIVKPFTSFQQRFFVYLAIKFGFNITMASNELMHQALEKFSPTIMSNDRYLWMSVSGRAFPWDEA